MCPRPLLPAVVLSIPRCGAGPTELTDELVSSVNSKHESDVEIDAAKDSIEMTLVKVLCACLTD